MIVPVFQEEKLLEGLLRLFNREVRKKYNFEVIVSDGGSTDRSIEIAEKYADTVVRHIGKERQNIAQGRNCGAEVARGKSLVFINADTRPANFNEFLDLIYKWSVSDQTKSDALACYVTGFPEEARFKDSIFYTLHNAYVWLLNMLGLGMGRGECQVISSDVFRKVGGYNGRIAAGEDFDLYRRISHEHKVEFNKKLHVLESPRRFRKYGYLKTIYYWTVNSLSVWFWGRSVSKDWEAVR